MSRSGQSFAFLLILLLLSCLASADTLVPSGFVVMPPNGNALAYPVVHEWVRPAPNHWDFEMIRIFERKPILPDPGPDQVRGIISRDTKSTRFEFIGYGHSRVCHHDAITMNYLILENNQEERTRQEFVTLGDRQYSLLYVSTLRKPIPQEVSKFLTSFCGD